MENGRRHMDKLYLTIPEAAAYVGIGENLMRDIMNSRDHPRFLRVGNFKRISKESLREWFAGKEEM